MNKEVLGYPGYYATEHGEIISLRSGTPKILKQRIHKGYYNVQVKKGAAKRTQVKVPVHQLVLYAFEGAKPSANSVCRHLNGNALDNRACNLKWGTVKENFQDQVDQGTAICLRLGELHPHSKLKKEQVIEIEREANLGISYATIASKFGIDKTHVSEIKLHKTWKQLWGMAV